MNFLLKHFFILLFSFFCLVLTYYFLKPVFYSNSIIIPYALKPFDICVEYPTLWFYLKYFYFVISFISHYIIFYSLSHFVISKFKKDKKMNVSEPSVSSHMISLYVGKDEQETPIYLPEKSLYQNIFITGTIGTGKTSSAMYPFTKQLIQNPLHMGMLILDVKGNYYPKVLEYAQKYQREDDIIPICLDKKLYYNPLDKPGLSPMVLANRLKSILLLFSKNNSDSYWLDKVEEVLANCIKFCRIYNHGYVTFQELHHLVLDQNYYLSKLKIVRHLFLSNQLSISDTYDLYQSLQFFQKEFFSLDHRVLSIIQSEIGRITNTFISEYNVFETFCPPKEKINFYGFQDVIQNGKIVVLNMNIAQYRNLSKIIAAYLKMDFQTEVLTNLKYDAPHIRPTAFICDEYHEYVTSNDADFFSQSREARCINIVATQSYTSLLNTLKDPHTTKVIIQSLINKLWFRTDDLYTIEEIQKQIGKEDKLKTSQTISENSKETHYHYLTHLFQSKGSNLSESINTYTQTDFVYQTNFFTQQLETFSCVGFLSTGKEILPPQKIKLSPYFKNL